jgi:ATP-binding cassette, subfamily B, bacterial
MEQQHQQPRLRDVFGFAARHWRAHARGLAVPLALMLAATGAEVAAPVATGRLIDALGVGAESPRRALDALLLLVGLGLLSQALRRGADYLWADVSVRIMRRIGADAFARVQGYSSEWHANTFAGSTVRNITRAVWSYEMFADALYYHVLPSALVVLGVCGVMAARWPVMAAAFLLGALAYALTSALLSVRYVAPRRRLSVESDSKVGGALADAISCHAAVRATAAEAREEARLAGILDTWQHLLRRSWFAGITVGVVLAGAGLLLQLLLVGGAVLLWSRGAATAGDVAYVLTSFFLVNAYLRDIGMHIRNLQRSANDLERVVEYERTPPEVADRPGAVPLRETRGAVAFEGVRFGYRRQPGWVFDGLDVRIAPGERVALVGASGSGKSTFVKLLQRLYDLDGGRILVDGQDIAGVTQESLRRAIALVPQDPVLFHRSLAENIAYARPEATRAQVEAAARKAHAHEFVERLPDGYETLVGERGVKLSGGERQRVAIARAILADRPILVLDEATSSLDSVSERLIQAALEGLTGGRTVIMIAHRLSTIRRADRILVFERGRGIVEEGAHAALMARPGGRYRRLHAVQAEGMADAASA